MVEVSNKNKKTTLVAVLFIVIIHVYSYQVSTASCIKQERESLLKLKASFIDSTNWLASWKGTDCCSWDGVGCNQSNGHVIKLDLRNYVHYNFSFPSLISSNGVDSSLFELKYLKYLDLSRTSFNYTQIPNDFSSMLELTYLNLSFTNFYGRIPSSLGNLTQLLVLDFKNVVTLDDGPRWFPGTKLFIDDLRWIASLSSLKYIDLSGVRLLQGNLDFISVLNTLPSLLLLKLNLCNIENIHHIHAPLNSTFISQIQQLDLSHNVFDGSIPNILRNITSLRFLDLSFNNFNSAIPLWLGNLINLVGVRLGGNLFTTIEGGLSSIITNNWQYLKIIDLSYNHFLDGDVFGSRENSSDSVLETLSLQNIGWRTTCRIPNWLGQLKNLKFLNLRSNLLYGPIPVSIGNLSNLEFLDMSDNLLNGGIHLTSFEKLSYLGYLNLRKNNLVGVIPESFGQLQSLKHLDVSENAFEGIVSEIHFANLSRLKVVHVSGNGLLSLEMKHDWIPPFQLIAFSAVSIKGFGSTEFPRWLETQKEMLELDLSNTSISGPIPTWLSLKALSYLDLSYNQFNGSVTESIADQMPNLQGLFIINAQINGSLPQSICRLNLNFLILPDNKLSGTIPNCLLMNPFLERLDLSSNNFSGVFPSSLENESLSLSAIQVMRLGNNKLEGEPLVAMRSWVGLFVLDLERNQFSGTIPLWLGERLLNLQILNLRGNMLNGTIPSTLWLLPQLQILILAGNKLVGNIPPNVANFCASPIPFLIDTMGCNFSDFPYPGCSANYVRQVMKSIDLNYSYLQLYSMVNIDLSNNNLYGHIPSGITTIQGLFALNLSHNNLSGTIPVEIGTTVSLESLDLSFNQLSGSIPNSLSRLSSLGWLKLSNNNFSGRIPREGQLLTFNNASSYEGNPYLCGDPLPVQCPNQNLSESPPKIDNFDDHDSHEGDTYEKMWFCIIVMLGYTLGFWAVVGGLIFKRSWRHAYFQFLDETKEKIHIVILMNMTRLKQRMGGNDSIYQ